MWQMKNKQMKVFERNKLDILKGTWLRLPKCASVEMVVNLPDLRYSLLTLFDYKSLCCRSPSKTILMYLNTLRVPLACHEAIMSHRDLHSSKITTIHQHLGPKRQNFKIHNPGSEFQNHPKSKSPAHIQSVKSKIKTKNKQMKVFERNKLDILKGNWLRLPKCASVEMVVNLPDLRYSLLTLFDYKSLCCRSPSKTILMYLNTLRVPLACHEAIMSHRDLHSSKITTIHQHLGPKRQNFKIQNPGSEFQNHPKSKSPAHIQSVKSKIKTKN